MTTKRKWEQSNEGVHDSCKLRLSCVEVPIMLGRQRLSVLVSMTDTYSVVQFTDLLTIFIYLFPNKQANVSTISLLQEYFSDKYHPVGPVIALPQRNALTIAGVIGWLQMCGLFELSMHEAHYFVLWILEELFPAMQKIQKPDCPSNNNNPNPEQPDGNCNIDDIVLMEN